MKEITSNYEVKKGDRLSFEFSIRSFWNAGQIKSALETVNQDPKLRVLDYRIEEHTWQEIGISSWIFDKLIVEIEVIQNPFPVMILAALIVSTVGLYFLSVTLDKMYLISESIPETAKTGLSMLALIGGAFAGYLILKKKFLA